VKLLQVRTLIGQSVHMATAPKLSPVVFEGNVANIGRDWSMTITSAPSGPPRRIDGYTIGAIPNIAGPGPHGGEVHPDGDEFLYIVNGAMELILDDGDEWAVGVETKVLLRTGDAYVVPRGVWHRLEAIEPSYLVHVTPGPNGSYRRRHPTAG
jgi:mannose-6-phosphate isomerase-like protein (cupin superfamily)